MRHAPALLFCLLLACPQAPQPPPAPPPPEPVLPPPPPQVKARLTAAPASRAELSTTDGETAVTNLSAALNGREKAIQRNFHLIHVSALFEYLLMRAQFLGKLGDYDRAEALAERFVKQEPKSPEALLLRARIRATLHRFAAARVDLAAAEKLGLEAHKGDGLRATLLRAEGKAEEALALVAATAKRSPDIMSIGEEAALRGDLGQVDQAEAMFIEAQNHHPDVSPFPLSWLYFQQALMWERQGRLGRARELLSAARERLLQYAPAVAHLAAAEAQTGGRARAIELLRPLASGTDDPEYAGQLSALLKDAGEKDEAERLRADARGRYEGLLKGHPEAYAAHAARFFLGAGGDAGRALKLAQQNLKTARLPESRELLVEAALAAGPPPLACAAAEQQLAEPSPSDRLRVLAARALTACGKQDRAAEVLKGVRPPE